MAIRSCNKLRDECLFWTNEGQDLERDKALSPAERQSLPYMTLLPPQGCRLEDFYAILRNR